MKYAPVDNTSSPSPTRPPSRLRAIYDLFADRFHSLKSCPRELYVNFVLKFLESYSYFAISQLLVIYLHEEFGFTDIQAGTIYGLWGISITFWGLCFSGINDWLGVRKSLLVGLSISTFATLTLACISSRWSMYFALFGFYPIGTAMGIPMMTVAIRRYTNKVNRGFAYGLYYAVMNMAAFVSGPMIDFFYIFVGSGTVIGGRMFTPNRLVILTTTLTSLSSVLTTYYFLREIKVSEFEHESNGNDMDDSMRVESIDNGVEMINNSDRDCLRQIDESENIDAPTSSQPQGSSSSSSSSTTLSNPTPSTQSQHSLDSVSFYADICKSATFRRFVVFALFLINLNAVFRHLDATLPTFLIRVFGDGVPKGSIYSINPFIIIFLAPVVAAVCTKYESYDMIKFGGFITAASPFFLAFSTSIWATVMMVATLSIGEAFWSPRTYSYTMSIAPEGKEASFSALASAPLFAAKVPVGMLSGYLLSTYVPENGHKDPKTLWLIIGLVTMTSPICITLLEKYIREPSKADTVGRAQNSFNPLHVPFVIRGDDDDDDDDECEEDKETGLEPESKVAHVVDGLFDDNYDAYNNNNNNNDNDNSREDHNDGRGDQAHNSSLDPIHSSGNNNRKSNSKENMIAESILEALFEE